ncbi:MAG: type IX secretion system membrane protein PorP/SprF [Elusimicrobiota bacterium]
MLTLLAAACYTPEARAAYEDVGVGARVTGMGNAYTALADDVYAVYYNPAGLATMDRPQLATTYSRLFTGLSDDSNLQNSFLAFAKPIQQGRQGAFGLAWNYFTLDSLYREMSFSGSYGRRLFAEQIPSGFYAGTTLKVLNRSLGDTGVADMAFSDTGQQNQGADPVLQKGSKTNIDTDVGLLYRVRPRFTLGLAVQHLLEPNIAFSDSDTDKLGRNIKLGGAYQTSWTSFSMDVDFMKAPDGSTDKVASLGVEKWLPTLMHGTLGMRGSIGAGDRQYRQVTAGLSYKVYRMQVDYSFAMPLGTVSGTYGTHRMGLSFRFGRPRGAEPRFSEAILENMRELAEVGTPEFRAQAESLALYKRTAQREFLRQAQVDTAEARFAEAHAKLDQALGLNPQDRHVAASVERMAKIASVFPELRDFRADPAQAALYEGIMDYLAGRDKDAVRKLSYAASLQPADERYERFLQVIEGAVGIAREVAPAAPAAPTLGKEKLVAAAQALLEVALREGDHDKVMRLAKEVLELDPANVLAYKRMAAAHYAKKEYEAALRSLRAAKKYETDAEGRRSLDSYISAMVSLLGKVPPPAAKPLEEGVPAKGASPYEVQRMFEAAADLYSQGRLSEAANMLQQILRVDPKNASAQRSLRRVQADLLEAQP